MVRDTSIQAYFEIVDISGKQRALVYEFLYKYGQSSDKEISSFLGIPINAITGRRNELLKSGHIVCCGKRPCKITKKTVYVWDVRQRDTIIPVVTWKPIDLYSS